MHKYKCQKLQKKSKINKTIDIDYKLRYINYIEKIIKTHKGGHLNNGKYT